ncbi:hypothetical protein [Photobacterium leiognathi]|uniref:hypothetical protein n=1 Tax=Photobacterium leiognathi TaxID=553611 RepID=UPI002980EBB4|nr:hypothetical protein [Photobacterium leiognathi]
MEIYCISDSCEKFSIVKIFQGVRVREVKTSLNTSDLGVLKALALRYGFRHRCNVSIGDRSYQLKLPKTAFLYRFHDQEFVVVTNDELKSYVTMTDFAKQRGLRTGWSERIVLGRLSSYLSAGKSILIRGLDAFGIGSDIENNILPQYIRAFGCLKTHHQQLNGGILSSSRVCTASDDKGVLLTLPVLKNVLSSSKGKKNSQVYIVGGASNLIKLPLMDSSGRLLKI